jgi:hypothetical protein
MRAIAVVTVALILGVPTVANAAISCSQLPEAQGYVDKLLPGPNTQQAQRHLDAARQATSDRACIAELRQVNKYAQRSAAADRRMGARGNMPGRRTVSCADALHQDRPGGSDYRGTPGTACH